MRILHSSDWHLGQHFMGKTRQVEHQAFLAWLIEQVQAQQVPRWWQQVQTCRKQRGWQSVPAMQEGYVFSWLQS